MWVERGATKKEKLISNITEAINVNVSYNMTLEDPYIGTHSLFMFIRC